MKYLYQKLTAALLFLFLGFSVKAVNDTLTRAQVYDFSVGDTFDYRRSLHSPHGNVVNYYREIIIDKHLSSLSDTIIYTVYYSNSGTTGSKTYTGLDSFKVFTKSTCDTMCAMVFRFDTMAETGIKSNSIEVTYNGWGSYRNTFVLAQGLGTMLYSEFYYDVDGLTTDTTELIYFSKGGFTWGTPYYILSSVEEIHNLQPSCRLYPNPATDEITIATENEAPVDVFIYDMPGNCVLSHKNFRPTSGNLKVTDLAPGYYLLKLTDQHGLASSKGFIIAR